MLAIQVRTIGEVALATQIKLAEGYHYDVPVDGLGIPYLPLRKILDAESWMSDDAMVGFAHPEGYLALTADVVVERTLHILHQVLPKRADPLGENPYPIVGEILIVEQDEKGI